MPHAAHDIGVARQIGTHSDVVEVAPGARWLMISGTPGLGADGAPPGDIIGQAEIAWSHILTILGRAGMGVHDLVKINSICCMHPTSRPMRTCGRNFSARRGPLPCWLSFRPWFVQTF